MKKVCIDCKKELCVEMFYRHKMMADGHLNKCKECVKKAVKLNRISKIDYYREYDRIRSHNENRVDARRLYRKTEQGKSVFILSNKKYRINNPNKYKAHCIVNNAIRSEKLFREPCVVCGDVKSQAHHDDYLKPLNVRWLCDKHHKQWHKENGEGMNR